MATLEQVEKLREKSGASYEACREALERSGDDLLEALIYLERTGRSATAPRGSYTTAPGARRVDEAAKLVLQDRDKKKKSTKWENMEWQEIVRNIWDFLRRLLRRATVNQFEVWRRERLMTAIPILILVLLILVAPWVSVPLLIVGMLVGCRYRFVGPDLDGHRAGEAANRAADTLQDVVGRVCDEVKDEFKRSGGEKKDR